jgi:GNAT superfamily N-acetyltransferase
MEIRALRNEEWTPAMALAWKTFLKFDAPLCQPEGVSSFYRFVTDETLEKMFLAGEYKAFGAFDGDEIVGVSGVRSGNFLSILFVDERYHRQGIATELVEIAAGYIRDVNKKKSVTVYAATGAIPFYLRVGFVQTEPMRQEAGMLFTPMRLELD